MYFAMNFRLYMYIFTLKEVISRKVPKIKSRSTPDISNSKSFFPKRIKNLLIIKKTMGIIRQIIVIIKR